MTRIIKTRFVFLAAAMLLANEIFCQEADFSSADEYLREALLASGCAEQDLASYEEKINSGEDEFLALAKGFSSQEETAERGLEFLYQKFMKKYSLEQTRLDLIVDNGKYNCVSSSVLFMHLMLRCGIECAGNETPGHAFCTVKINGRKIDVETTNPYGFEPGKKKQLTDKRYLVTTKKNYMNRKEVGGRGLVALIYKNRIADLQKARRYEETLALAYESCRIQHNSPESLAQLRQAAGNIIGERTRRGQPESALEFAREFLASHEGTGMIRDNIAAACSSIISKNTKKKAFAETEAFLKENAGLLDSKNYARFEYANTLNALGHAVDTEDFDSALQKVLAKDGFLKADDFSALLASCHSKEAARLEKEDPFLAYDFARDAAAAFPVEKKISQLATSARQSCSVQTHNKIVPLLNSKNYDKAQEIVLAAIERIGETKLLQNDLQKIKKSRK